MRCVIQTGPDGLDQTLTVSCECAVDGVPQTVARTYRIDETFRKIWAGVVRRYGAPVDPAQAAVGGWGDMFKTAVNVSRRAVRNKALRSILDNPAAGIAAGLIPGGAAGLAAAKLITKASQGHPAAKAKIRAIRQLAETDPRAARSLALLRKVKTKMEAIAASRIPALAAPSAAPAVGGRFRTPSRWLIDQVDGRPGAAISARALYSRGLGQVDHPAGNLVDYAKRRAGSAIRSAEHRAVSTIRDTFGI